MSKAILVIEMPENCNECPLEMDVEDTTGKKWRGNICRGCGSRNQDKDKRPDWCSLVPIPERKKEMSLEACLKDSFRNEFISGWNACLDAIEGSKKHEEYN